MHAIIKADLDYDALLGMEFHSLYDTYEAAQAFIRQMEQQEIKQQQEKVKYITEYVCAIQLPENPDYKTWQAFIAGFEPFTRLNPQNFKTELISNLSGEIFVNQFWNRPDYKPPLYTRISHRLHIVEIPGITISDKENYENTLHQKASNT